MPNFSYVAINLNGNEIRGTHVAPDEKGVANMLHQQGYYATSIKKGGGSVNLSNITIGTPVLKVKVVARFCTQVAAMLRSGVPIVRTLEILSSESEDVMLKNILEDINSSIKQGSSLSQAVEPHVVSFPVLFHSMVEAGEASGTLDACLERAGVSFTRAAKLQSRVKGAMIYPSIILSALIGMLLLMLLFVVPQFAEIYGGAGADLPAFTLFLLAASEFLQEHFLVIFMVVIAAIVIIITFFKTDFGRLRLDKFKTRVPVISKLINKVYAARFTRSLSSLVAAGVNMPTALEISARTIVNTFLQKRLATVVDDVKQGVQLSDAFDNVAVLPQLVSSVTKIGEESGELEGMLTQLANYYDDESDSAIQALLTMMEPALILLMAGIVVPILLGVLQPMFGMVDALS